MKILTDLINLFYPGFCLLCKEQLTESEQHFCIDCLCNMPKTNYHADRDNPAKKLFAGYPQVNEVSAYLFFEKENKTQKIIHSFKYHRNSKLAEFMGRIAALELKGNGFFSTIETLIPVPLHIKKEKKRGYNQSEYIARGIASLYHCNINNKNLQRTVHRKSQTRKSVYDRHVNVENIFTVTDTDALFGKHILLVDDVITTGATTSACIDALLKVPEIKISIFSLSIAHEN